MYCLDHDKCLYILCENTQLVFYVLFLIAKQLAISKILNNFKKTCDRSTTDADMVCGGDEGVRVCLVEIERGARYRSKVTRY